MKSTLCVIGGQYGSEGKGTVVQHIAKKFGVHVRVGGPNAGHSICHKNRVFKMRSVPCGWINKNAVLIIGAGAMVDLHVLEEELKLLDMVDPTVRERLFVDHQATIITDIHRQYEVGLRCSIGSTGEGVGAARICKISRDINCNNQAKTYKQWFTNNRVRLCDTYNIIFSHIASGSKILIEGTQGAGLSLTHGPWPYTTSTDISAAQLLADVGLPPREASVLMVLRTFPIRVAGNSGPMKYELSWKELSTEIGIPVEERTTVTGNIRRVARFDPEQVGRAVDMNGPDFIALNFIDYISPADRGVDNWDDLSDIAKDWIQRTETFLHVPVKFIGTGWKDGYGWVVIER